jgi:hypothetical protein
MIDSFLRFFYAKYPELTGVAALLLVALTACYFIFRMRYQGKIDELEERIKRKDDAIKMKDDAIASASATATATVPTAPPPAPAAPALAPAPTPTPTPAPPPFSSPKQTTIQNSAKNQRWANLNAQIVADAEAKILSKLATSRYKFVFNPKTGGNKVLTFKSDGNIGEGKNQNECRWRVAGGKLEILNDHGELYSRFFVLPDDRMHHTNDPDTLSIKGQYLEPLS